MALSLYLSEILTLASIALIGAINPGPDFALITRNSLLYPRKIAVFTTFGTITGITMHVTYSLFGIGVLITKTTWAFTIVKVLGCSYLFYIGTRSILKSIKHHKAPQTIKENKKDLTPMAAYRMGFLTNALNPTAILFFLCLFTSVISLSVPPAILVFYGAEVVVVMYAWFLFLALGLSYPRLQKWFSKYTSLIEGITGLLLVLLGIKLLFAEVAS